MVIKVGVVRGGPSSEHEVSIKTGGEVLNHLPKHYKGVDILLTKDRQWHVNGFAKEPAEIFQPAFGRIDVVFNALHGEFGEDGRAQQVFESFGVPYTGSRIVPSSLAMNKHLARELFGRHGIKIPRGLVFKKDDFFGLDAEDCARRVFGSMSPPWVVKPASAGSSVGVSVCDSFFELIKGLERAAHHGSAVLVEEYIKGVEATCGVLGNFLGKEHYALPPIEIIPAFANPCLPAGRASAGKPSFFDYGAKYDGSTHEICPAGFDMDTKREIERVACEAHKILGLRHYSRADFIVSPRNIYLLEVNTLPGLTAESLLPKAARAAGLEFPALLDHLIQLALNKR